MYLVTQPDITVAPSDKTRNERKYDEKLCLCTETNSNRITMITIHNLHTRTCKFNGKLLYSWADSLWQGCLHFIGLQATFKISRSKWSTCVCVGGDAIYPMWMYDVIMISYLSFIKISFPAGSFWMYMLMHTTGGAIKHFLCLILASKIFEKNLCYLCQPLRDSIISNRK